MNTGSYRQFFTIVIIIVIVQLACTIPVQQTSDPADESNNLAATKGPAVNTADEPTQVDTPTNSPSAVPTKTRTPIPTVTLTPLPTLPDFDRVLSFGGGGAGLLCVPFTDPVYSFVGDPSYFMTGNLPICLVLSATDYDKPFIIQVYNPDGEAFTSNSIVINGSTQTVEWDGYPGFYGGSAGLGENGNLYVDLYLLWRPNFLQGEWRIYAGFENGHELIDYFEVTKPAGKSYIAAVGGGPRSKIVPPTSDRSLRPVKLRDNGTIGVIGSDFPQNAVVYVLLYRVDDLSTAELMQKFSVDSDSAGSIETEISASFVVGQTYYLIGITDPNTPLADCVIGGCDYASDLFEIIP